MATQQSPYDPGFVAFGGGSAGSILHPVVLLGAIAAVALAFLLPRKYVILPVLLGILLVPSGQNVNFGIHFYIYRTIIMAGWIRLCVSKSVSREVLAGGFVKLDKVFLLWAIYRSLAATLQFLQVGAVIYQVALLVDSVGGYFLFRCLIRDEYDVRRVVKSFAVVAVISSFVMANELRTGQNILGLLGGIGLVSAVRNGRIRAQGVFQHAILAGSFGATVFPMFLWLWKRGRDRLVAVVGAVSSSIMVFACASSTPIGAWMATFVAVCLWPFRRQMRLIRWAIVIALAMLAITMKAPIWYVLARIDFAGGSTGWDRAFLIDTFTRHFADWWLIGSHANVNWGWDMWDQCNQFVSEGETGGLVALTCFIGLIVICFQKTGNARQLAEGNRRQEWLYWLLGTTMLAQVIAYMGVDYFDQSKFVWYALLATFVAATNPEYDAAGPRAVGSELAARISPHPYHETAW